jgi:hypothetical protein
VTATAMHCRIAALQHQAALPHCQPVASYCSVPSSCCMCSLLSCCCLHHACCCGCCCCACQLQHIDERLLSDELSLRNAATKPNSRLPSSTTCRRQQQTGTMRNEQSANTMQQAAVGLDVCMHASTDSKESQTCLQDKVWLAGSNQRAHSTGTSTATSCQLSALYLTVVICMHDVIIVFTQCC